MYPRKGLHPWRRAKLLRKPADDEAEKPAETPAKKAKTSPKSPKVVEKKKTAKKAKKEKKEAKEQEEEQQVEEAEGDKQVEEEPEDVAMQDVDNEEEEEASLPVSPGRRRLRQRVVADEDSDSDSDVPFAAKSPAKKGNGELIDVTSPPSSPAKAKSPAKKELKQTSSSPRVKRTDAKETEEEEASETVDEENKEEVVATEKEMLSPAASKTKASTGFFTPQSSKGKTKATSTPTDDTKASKGESKAEPSKTKPGVSEKEEAEANEEQDEENNEPRVTSYVALANLFAKIEEVSGRLVIQDLLMTFFRDVIRHSPDDLLACIYLCVCVDLAPPFENLKIGIGDAILMKAIGEATGTNLKFIKEMYHKEGDLGKVAQNARSKQHTLSFASTKPASAKPSVLSVQDVYNQFVKIAKMTGNNSQQQKCSIIKGLLVKCEKDKKAEIKGVQSAEGAKFIIRGLQGKLRIGLAEKSILIGLTYAFMTEKEQKDKDKQQEALAFVKKAFAECPSYNALVAAFMEVQKEVATAPLLRVKDFAKVAEKCVLTPGTPVSPMLARPTKAYAMVFDRFDGKPFTCE
ncbi:hypothetical protein BBJ28_00020290, partial [Nothophytophthora sp. Chile5]